MPTNNSKKRILYVENGIGYGGAVICLKHLVKNLDRSKYLPMVITGRTGPHYQEIEEEALWKYIPDRHIDIVGAHQKIDPLNWPETIPGLRFIINQILARIDDFANFLPFFLQLIWTAKVFKADLIHANNEPLCNRAALLTGKVLNIPTVCHVRGDQEGSRLMRWAFTLPETFIAVSEWIGKNIQKKMGVDPNKIDVIYDGIELNKLKPDKNLGNFRNTYNIKESDFAVGLIGLLIPWKGQELLIDAAKNLKEIIPNLKVVIVGGTPNDFKPYENSLHQQIKDDQLEDLVIFTGHISDMASVYSGLDVVLSASTSPEPLGIVVLECMAMGRPLVAPNHGGAPELMRHEQTGLLFEPKNPSSLASAIERLYKDEALRVRLGHNARQHALETFSVVKHSEKVQKIYDKLLNQQTQ
jgi:glycosyltransferase involved in cell wall biosynthesis